MTKRNAQWYRDIIYSPQEGDHNGIGNKDMSPGHTGIARVSTRVLFYGTFLESRRVIEVVE